MSAHQTDEARPRYLICPGIVKSRKDGDRHYISAGQLAALYKVRPTEYVILPEPSCAATAWTRKSMLEKVETGELIPLHPQYSGDYTLPTKETTMTTNEQNLEALIQSKGLTAPRVTPQDLAANIKHYEFVKYISHGGQVLRWCVITTTSGYAVTGDPSCSASSANDNQEVGETIALDNAKRAMWPLMGYALKERLSNAG